MNAPIQPPIRVGQPEVGLTRSGALHVVVVLLLVWHLGPVAPFLPPEYFSATAALDDMLQEQQILRLSWLPVYAITILLAGARLPAVWRAASCTPVLVALMILVLTSTLWSLSPADTLRRTAALACTSLLGLYLAARFELRQLIRLFGWASAAVMALSVLFVLARPEVGISGLPHPGAWRGVFATKNGLGQTMLLALVTFLVLAGMSQRRRWPLLAAVGATALLVLSTAKTPVAVACVLTPVALLVRAAHRHPSRAGYLAAVAAAGAFAAPFVLFVALEPVLALLGRDLTLTGRSEIWRLAWEKIQEQPLLGYGYGAFWSASSGPVLDIWYVTGWIVPNAHNGYLDLMLSFGVLGLPLYSLLALRTIVRMSRMGAWFDPWSALWAVCFMTLFLIYGFSESSLMEQNTIIWLLVVALAAYAGRPAPRAAPHGASTPLAALRPAPARVPS